MTGRVQDKIALVTGGASGIGRAIVQALVNEGAKVLISDLNADAGQALAEELGSAASFIRHDAASEADWNAVADFVRERYGRLDVLVNNAGILLKGSIEEASLDDWHKLLRVNSDSAFLGCRMAVALMKDSGGGSIINVSSIAALAGRDDYAAYGASKGAVAALNRAVAAHCRRQKYRIRCNSLHPDGVLTPMTVASYPPGIDPAKFTIDSDPMNRMCLPEDVASAALYLASDESRAINGMELRIDSGQFVMKYLTMNSPEYISLRVAQVIEETADARSLVFEVPAELAEQFKYKPGQFLTLRIPHDGSWLPRCYSLSSTPLLDEPLRVTVKRVRDGRASNWLCDVPKAGDAIEVMAPAGVFVPRSLDGDFLLFGGGSGVTPVLSILRSVLHAGSGRVLLIYANRDEASVIFRDELKALASAHPSRLQVIHWLDSVQGIPAVEQLAELARPFRHAEAFICGPGPFMDAAVAALHSLDVPSAKVHVERFVSLPGEGEQGEAVVSEAAVAAHLEVRLDGAEHALDCQPGETLLDAMRRAGVRAPHSCLVGACASCMCTVEQGEVELLRNEALDQQELNEGWTLACQAVATSAHVRVRFPTEIRMAEMTEIPLTNPAAEGVPPTIPALVFAAARRHAGLCALADGEVRIDYAELPERVLAVTRALIAEGIQPGDRVAVWGPNRHDWILAALGLHCAGATLVPINTRMKGNEAADILERSGTRLLFCVGQFLGVDYPAMLEAHRPDCLERVVVLPCEAPSDHGDLGWDAFLATGAAVDLDEARARALTVRPDDLSDLLFTSGTTGKPKGVMSAHGQNLRAFAEYVKVIGLRPGDRYLIVNPFFHAFGYKAGWLTCLLGGATILPHPVFDAEAVFQRIERDRITVLPGPPTLYLSMLAHPKLAESDLSSLRIAVTGAATIPPVLVERMRRELGFAVVTTAYGLTECGGLATICDPADDAETVATTCGRALPGTEVRIVDGDNRPLPPGEAGEVCLRGFHVMQGYFENPQATAETIDAEGWLHTGDVGTLDARGYLRITDRLKDMFIVGGFNCYPAEIEAGLLEHPAIAQVAVIGVPDERMGEVGCACVVLRPGQQLDEPGLIAWSRQRMANYKVPRLVRFFEALPVNASNKVVKGELRVAVG